MNRVLYYSLMVILACIVVACSLYLYSYFSENHGAEEDFKELAQYIGAPPDFPQDHIKDKDESVDAAEAEKEAMQEKFMVLHEMNEHFAGWITIPGTKIDYPVVQCMEDEEYYLRRDFNGEKSMAGVLFIDTDCNLKKPSTNIMIYGHNMRAGTMFHDLLKYADESFYQEHRQISFNSLYHDGVYEVIAAFYTEIGDVDADVFKYYTFFDAGSENEFRAYVDNCRSRTKYETPDAVYGDQLLTLSTCSYHKDYGRFVVVAKKIL